MSAIMFGKNENNPTETQNSRIPVLSTSPLPIRRSHSMRLKGEKFIQHPTLKFSQNRGCLNVDKPNAQSHYLRDDEIINDLRHEGRTRTSKKIGVNGVNCIKTDYKHFNTLKGGLTPQTPRTKTLSLSFSNTKLYNQKSPTISLPSTTPPTSPFSSTNQSNNHEWDLESLGSTTSNLSLSSCDHAAIARNGTTFSGRSMRYIFHCNQNAGISGEEYLTPTQRAHRQIRKLKQLLQQAQAELEQKDSDILKLTKEVVELRLYKAAINSPEDKSNSSNSDAVTVKENNSDEQITPESVNGVNNDSGNSHNDSGHFDELESSKQNLRVDENPKEANDKSVETSELGSSEQKLILEYEKRIHELIKVHEEENSQIKQRHNDKIEELLLRIGDINQRYWQIVPELDAAKERIKDLEKQLEDSCKKLERLESEKETKLNIDTQVMDIAKRSPSRLSVPELLQELQVTKNELENLKDTEYASSSNNLQPLLSAKEALSLWVLGARKAMYRQLMEAKNKNKIDPEVTLQFLKSAIYYFLTDKENTVGHLKAIQSILGFSSTEINNIDKAQLL